MKSSNLLMAGVALAFLAGGVNSAFAQAQSVGPTDQNPYSRKKVSHGHAARSDIQNNTYRPLTVSPTGVAPVDAGVGVADAVLGGVGSLVTAPISGLGGGSVGISPDVAPPIPIKARYANTGPVADSIEEGYTKPIPVDKSGPIYMLDNDAKARTITPFSLFAFPLTGATSILTSPLRGTPGA